MVPRSLGAHHCCARGAAALDHGDNAEAFLLVQQARDVLPDDRHLWQLLLDVSLPAVLRPILPVLMWHSPHTRHPPPGFLSARRPSTTSAFHAASSECGFPRRVFSRSRSLHGGVRCATAGSRGCGAAGDGARRRRRILLGLGWSGDRRLLDRSIRGHQSAVQSVRRSRRVPSSRLLERAIHRRRPIRTVGGGRRPIS